MMMAQVGINLIRESQNLGHVVSKKALLLMAEK